MKQLITEENVRVYGRYGKSGGAITLCWVNSGIEARYIGSGLSLTLESAMPDGVNDVFLQVWTDGERGERLRTHSGMGEYTVADGLPFGEHTTRILAVSECQWQPLSFISLTVCGGQNAQLLPPERRSGQLKFDFYGDSLTCGVGTIPGCPDPRSQDQDSSLAHAFRTAEYFGGDGEYTAISGWGCLNGWGGDTNGIMPRIWNRVSPVEAEEWDVAGRAADIIIVMLGTNDYSVPLSEDDFVAAYISFFEKLRAACPAARIFCTAPGEPGLAVRRAAEEFSRRDAGGAVFVEVLALGGAGYEGSYGHPNGEWGAAVSAKFITAIEKTL